ncbi:MAG: thioredoxin domain-containing protein [Betaproteobacteria bacterium]|nr:thioredoxin domain-containing protein [Betaproteobacteria bacterium]
MKRFATFLASLCLALSTGIASADVSAPKDYKPLPQPQPPETPGKIEVLEFFQYGCSHCYDFEPAMQAWVAKKPKDVEFRFVPTVWDASRIPQAKLYYTLEALGLVDKYHDKIYEGIHEKHLKLWDPEVLKKWVAQQPGIDAQKFWAAYNSFGVDNNVRHAEQLTKAYRIMGTPTIAVAGRYLTGPSHAIGPNGEPDYGRVQEIINELIAKARKSSGK